MTDTTQAMRDALARIRCAFIPDPQDERRVSAAWIRKTVLAQVEAIEALPSPCAPSTELETANDDLVTYVILQRVGMVPQRKGPYTSGKDKKHIEEMLRGLYGLYHGCICIVAYDVPRHADFQHGYEWLDMYGDRRKKHPRELAMAVTSSDAVSVSPSIIERAFDLGFEWRQMLNGHIFDGRDVARPLTASMFDGLSLDMRDIEPLGAGSKSAAIVEAKTAIKRSLIAATSPASNPSAPSPKCVTCNGVGLIGGHCGQTAESYEERSEPCPDCNAPADLAARILALKRKGSSGSDYYGAEDSWNDAIEAAADLVSAWESWQIALSAPDAAQAGGDGLAVTDAMVVAAWRAFLMEATPAPLSPFNNENKPAMRSALVAALKVAADAAQEAKP